MPSVAHIPSPDDDALQTLTDDDQDEILASFQCQQGGQPSALALKKLCAENDDMRQTIADLRQSLEELVAKHQANFDEREQAYEARLEEQSEQIRMLYLRLRELESSKRTDVKEAGVSALFRSSERAELAAELQSELSRLNEDRQRLEDERKQLRQDENDLLRRMKEMELQTAKAHTEMVQQRDELKQKYNQIHTELEEARQAGTINERMKPLLHAHQKIEVRTRN